MNQLKNRTYIVAGASSGIGKSVAEYLTKEIGANVVLIARRRGIIEKMAEELPGENHAITYDLCDVMNIGEIFEKCKQWKLVIHGMVYAAGVAPLYSLKENDPVNMLNTMKVNALSFAEMAKGLLNYDKLGEEAAVVAISSIVSEVSTNRQSAYAASKAALNTYVKYFAKEAMGKIRVNALLLGAVHTEMYQELCSKSENLEERMKSYYPLGVISTEQVDEMIAYLLSERAKYMTGSLVQMDAGYMNK